MPSRLHAATSICAPALPVWLSARSLGSFSSTEAVKRVRSRISTRPSKSLRRSTSAVSSLSVSRNTVTS